MTKTIILNLAFLASSFLSYSSGNNSCELVTEKQSSFITTLIVNAAVTVVLISDEQAAVEMNGNKKFTQVVNLKTEGDTLTIAATGSTWLLGRGTVYVPARNLRNIQINSGAIVRSYYPLQSPKLDVTVNGECHLAISNIGAVNIIETEKFSAEQSIEAHPLPAGFAKKKA